MENTDADSDSKLNQVACQDEGEINGIYIAVIVSLIAVAVIWNFADISTIPKIIIFGVGGLLGSFFFMLEACIDDKKLSVNFLGKTKITPDHKKYIVTRITLGFVSSWIIYLLFHSIDSYRLLAYSLAAGFSGNLLGILSKSLAKLVGDWSFIEKK